MLHASSAQTDQEGSDRIVWRIKQVGQLAAPSHVAAAQDRVPGRRVVATGSGKLRAFTLRGAYRGYNPLPYTFSLDGSKCRAEVMGSVAHRDQVGEAAAGKRADAERDRPPRRSNAPQGKADGNGPAAPSLPPPTVPPAGRTGPGFSLAL